MTKAEAAATLLEGAAATNCQYLTVLREHLMLALGDEYQESKESHDDVQGYGESRVDDPA